MKYVAVLTAYDKDGNIVTRVNGSHDEYYNKPVDQVMSKIAADAANWERLTIELKAEK